MANGDYDSTSWTLLQRLYDLHDNLAWMRFVARYQPLIDKYARRLGCNETAAEDLAAEVLVKLVQSIGQYDREKGAFRPWLKTIVIRAHIDGLRKKRARLSTVSAKMDAYCAVPLTQEEQGFAEESSAEVEQVLWKALTATGRAMAIARQEYGEERLKAFLAYKVEKRPAKEVGKEFGMTQEGVRVTAHRIAKRLRAILDDNPADEGEAAP